jgi:hypothetical protein
LKLRQSRSSEVIDGTKTTQDISMKLCAQLFLLTASLWLLEVKTESLESGMSITKNKSLNSSVTETLLLELLWTERMINSILFHKIVLLKFGT